MISPKKNRNEKSESKRLNWTCIPKKKCSWRRLGCIKNWWGFHSPPFVRQFGQMENADKRFSLNTCPLLINTFRKYIANESFEFQHLKCNRAQKKSNELWAIDSNRKCILKRCVALSFNRAAYPFTGTLHTHARTKTIQCTLSYGPLIGLSTGMKLSEQNLWPHLFIYAASCILSVYGVKMRKQSMFCAIEVDSPVSASAHTICMRNDLQFKRFYHSQTYCSRYH